MRRKRIIEIKKTICEFIFLFIAIFITAVIIDLAITPKSKEYEFKEYTISSGERLWDIAKEEAKENSYYTAEDIRQIVYEIRMDNDLEDALVYPGQVIKIRIKKDELSNTLDKGSLDNTSNNS